MGMKKFKDLSQGDKVGKHTFVRLFGKNISGAVVAVVICSECGNEFTMRLKDHKTRRCCGCLGTRNQAKYNSRSHQKIYQKWWREKEAGRLSAKWANSFEAFCEYVASCESRLEEFTKRKEPMKTEDIYDNITVGSKISKLTITAIEETHFLKAHWRCITRCDCGNEHILPIRTLAQRVRNGEVLQCHPCAIAKRDKGSEVTKYKAQTSIPFDDAVKSCMIRSKMYVTRSWFKTMLY